MLLAPSYDDIGVTFGSPGNQQSWGGTNSIPVPILAISPFLSGLTPGTDSDAEDEDDSTGQAASSPASVVAMDSPVQTTAIGITTAVATVASTVATAQPQHKLLIFACIALFLWWLLKR